MNESEEQFSFTRAALSTWGHAKSKFLLVLQRFKRLIGITISAALLCSTVSICVASAPNIHATSVSIVDGVTNIVPVAGKWFLCAVQFTYTNPTTNYYRISYTVAGITNVIAPINWGTGLTGTSSWGYGLYLLVPQSGNYNLTVKVDCDDAIPGANIADKSLTIPVTVFPPLNTYDFSGWEKFFESHLTNDGAGGFEWLGMENGQVIAKGSSGYGRSPWEPINPSVPLTTTNPMHLASISKLITQVGLGKLWELKRGTPAQFSYDDLAAPYLLPEVTNMHPTLTNMTINQLRSMTSGLTNDCSDLPSMQTALSRPAAWPPGSNSYYLNGNYYILAFIMQKIAGQPYDAFVRTNALIPLGMTKTTVTVIENAPALIYGPATLHRPGILTVLSGTQLAGPYGWWSNAEDLGRLLYGLRYSTIFQPDTAALVGYTGGTWWWAGGWSWDDGIALGYLSTCVYRLSDHVDAVLLINSNKGDAPTLLQQAFALPQSGLVIHGARSGANMSCSFLALAGYSYTLLTNGTLGTTNWLPYTTVTGSNTTQTVSVPRSGRNLYMRLRQN